jgi:hypothetical protein
MPATAAHVAIEARPEITALVEQLGERGPEGGIELEVSSLDHAGSDQSVNPAAMPAG